MGTYVKPAPNATAVCQLRSWLAACGIKNRPGADGVDLVVEARDGREVRVALVQERQQELPVGIEIRRVAELAFPELAGQKTQSGADAQYLAVKNALRRLVVGGYVRKLDRGTYGPSVWRDREVVEPQGRRAGQNGWRHTDPYISLPEDQLSERERRTAEVIRNHTEVPDPTRVVRIHCRQLTAEGAARAMAAFHRVTRAAGLGEPVPVDRGPEPGRITHEEEPDLVEMRHRELRRVPNPPAAKYARYMPVVDRCCWNFYRANKRTFDRLGLELRQEGGTTVGDLKTMALSWITIYMGLYERPEEECTNDDNERKSFAFLWQRFVEYLKLKRRSERSVLPDMDTALVGLYGEIMQVDNINQRRSKVGDPETPLVGQDFFDMTDPRITVEEREARVKGEVRYALKRTRLDRSSPDARRRSAQEIFDKELSALPVRVAVARLARATRGEIFCADTRAAAAGRLERLLAPLSHDERLELLTSTAADDSLCEDERRAVAGVADEHRRGCAECLPRRRKEDEDARRVDPPRAEE